MIHPLALSIASALMLGSSQVPTQPAPQPQAPAEKARDPSTGRLGRIEAAVAQPGRSAANVARDRHRNPAATLNFFEVDPNDTVVEIWPGGGWYTEILAPYLTAGGGKLYAAAPDWGMETSTANPMAKAPPTRSRAAIGKSTARLSSSEDIGRGRDRGGRDPGVLQVRQRRGRQIPGADPGGEQPACRAAPRYL